MRCITGRCTNRGVPRDFSHCLEPPTNRTQTIWQCRSRELDTDRPREVDTDRPRELGTAQIGDDREDRDGEVD